MRVWRLKRDKTVRQQLEQFAYDESSKKKTIIDSSQLVGARVILKYLQRRKQEKLGVSTNMNDDSKNKASSMEQDIRKRRSNQSPGQEDRLNPKMPQINEVENEDRDHSREATRRGNNNDTSRNKNGNIAVSELEQRSKQSFQGKTSEPGNKQGYDEPVGEGGMSNFDDSSISNVRTDQVRSTQVRAAERQGNIEGSSFDEYNRNDKSELQDIQSPGRDGNQFKLGPQGGRNQNQGFNTQTNQPNAGP